MTVRELITKWTFQTDHAPLHKIEEQLEGIKHRLEFLAAAEVMHAIYELTEKFAHFAEELHIAAASAGLTVEAFQKLAFAAGQSGISQDEMAMSMARLSKHLYQARQGGEEAQKAFSAAGFTPEQIHSFKTGQDVMLALADRMKGMQDPIQKQALAMQLMGRGSVNMVGFLSQGSGAIKGLGQEAENLGTILREDQVEALVKMEHALQKVWAVIKNLGATFVSYLSPAITTAIDHWLKFYSANKKIIEQNIRQWAYDFGYVLGYLSGILEFVMKNVFEFAKSHQTLVLRIIEVVSALALLSLAFFAVMKVVGLLKGAMGVLGGGFSVIMSLVKGAMFVFRMLSTVIPIVTGFLADFAAVLFASPIGWLAIAVVVIHDLWVLLKGGKFEDTWLGQAFNWMMKLGGMIADLLGLKELLTGGIVGNVGDMLGGLKDKVGGALQHFIGIGGPDALAGAGKLAQTPDTIGAGVSSANNTYSVNAPITVSVQGGGDPQQMAKSVREGVKEHLDRVHRDAQRSLRPATAY